MDPNEGLKTQVERGLKGHWGDEMLLDVEILDFSVIAVLISVSLA